ncbi:hypothetical protein Cfor_06778 [Coptotermes formosanus]|uniref:Uncharacterized protein n=1 Tax=Coptotermes formosanus TaxID=36987 RepID=A0A6L2PIJ1_COPFO|nr:hypothetical protein Cfor_06778 [Coptotermes formosanus]
MCMKTDGFICSSDVEVFFLLEILKQPARLGVTILLTSLTVLCLEVKETLRLPVSQSVRLGPESRLGYKSLKPAVVLLQNALSDKRVCPLPGVTVFVSGGGTETDRTVIQAALAKQKLEERKQYILNKCIQHHQAILRFVKKLEAFLQPVMIMQLFVSMIAFCVIGFQMSMIQIHTDAMKFVKFLVSLLSAFIEQGMFYWFGGEMLEEVRVKCM